MTDRSKDDGGSSGRANTADTVPPPATGDAYNAATQVREAPPDLLDIMRQVKDRRAAKAQEPQSTATGDVRLPPPPDLPRVDLTALLGEGPRVTAADIAPPSTAPSLDAAPPMPAARPARRVGLRMAILIVLAGLFLVDLILVFFASHHAGP